MRGMQERPPRVSAEVINTIDNLDLAQKLWGLPMPGGPRIGATVTSGTSAMNKAHMQSRGSKGEVRAPDSPSRAERGF